MIRPIALPILAVAALLGLRHPDDKEDVAKAAEKTRALENYKFKGKIAVDGVPFLAEPIDYTGAYVKDQGFTASIGPVGTIFRVGKKVAVKDTETGTWTLVKTGQAKAGEGPLANQIPMVARGLKPPHEEFKKFEERFKEIKKKDGIEKVGDLECAVYEGPLTENGVRGMLPGGVGVLLGKGTFEGTARVWIGGPDRRIVKLQADCKIGIDDEARTFEMTVSRTTEFSDVGAAKVEMPAEVKKLFEETETK